MGYSIAFNFIKTFFHNICYTIPFCEMLIQFREFTHFCKLWHLNLLPLFCRLKFFHFVSRKMGLNLEGFIREHNIRFHSQDGAKFRVLFESTISSFIQKELGGVGGLFNLVMLYECKNIHCIGVKSRGLIRVQT